MNASTIGNSDEEEYLFQCTTLSLCPSVIELTSDDSHSDDATWVLTASFVILTMQTGFGMLEMSSCARGYEVHILLKNVLDVLFGGVAFYLVGYGVAFGSPATPFMGMGDFVPDGYAAGNGDTGAATLSGLQYARYLFILSFAATSTTIVSGCVAMRMRFFAYGVYAFFAVIFFCFVAHWFWSDDGWLAQMGTHDFAGGGPVHLLGATNGLIAILMVGPRTGRFDGTRPRSDFMASSPASMLVGLFILWWGWIGFNTGSSYGITNDRWIVAARAGMTTINSSCSGGMFAIMYTLWRTKGKYVLTEDIVNGILGSLVAITPTCVCVHNTDSFVIGFIGAIVSLSCNALAERMKLDDPVGALGVHGGSAIWGLVAVGLFADSELPGLQGSHATVRDGLFRGGGGEQLGVQCIAILAVIGWSVMTCFPFFYIQGVILSQDWKNPRKGLRVTIEEEIRGADACLHCVIMEYEDEPPHSSRRGGDDNDESTRSDVSTGRRKSMKEMQMARKQNKYSSSSGRSGSYRSVRSGKSVGSASSALNIF